MTGKILDRRNMLKLTGLGLGSVVLNQCSSAPKKEEEGLKIESTHQTFRKTQTSEDDGPIDRTLGEIAPMKFSGDDPDHTHQILWDTQGFLSGVGGRVPDPTEKAPVVIVGGGMSGLMSAYKLKKYIPIVLERADRFGGFSRGESWRGLDYSIGAAYMSKPADGSPLDNLLKELELQRLIKPIADERPVCFKGKLFQHFLKGDTDPALAAQGGAIERYFTEVVENKNGKVYPEIPPQNEAQSNAIKELDKMNFREHIKKVLATDTIHPQIDTWFEHYCWSTMGCSFREMSAAVGVNLMAADFGPTITFPGGNSAIAEALLRKIKKAVGPDRIRSRAVVFQVKLVGDAVWVTYEKDGHVKTIEAESVIIASPKYVVRRILADIEPEREKVIRKIRYNSYVVANVLLNQKVPGNYYDVYLLGDGKINGKDIQASSEEDRCTDLINGTFAKEDGKNGILTFYRPLPYLGGRAQLFSSGSYLKYRKELIQQLETEVLPALGIPATAVSGIRLSRWGHPMAVPQPGIFSKGHVEWLHKPIANKIYFVNQDNWLNPCIETIFGEMNKWAPVLEKSLEERRLAKQKQSTNAGPGSEEKSAAPVPAPTSAPAAPTPAPTPGSETPAK